MSEPKLPKHLETVLKKMFEYVDCEYDESIVTDPERAWYSEHSWTSEQEKDFEEWFVDYLYNNTEARKEMYDNLPKRKKAIREAFNWFSLSYGWMLKD